MTKSELEEKKQRMSELETQASPICHSFAQSAKHVNHVLQATVLNLNSTKTMLFDV